MASVDVSIRGAGIFGLSIAWACVQRGARVEVVDPHGPGAGASGGLVGALAPHVPENWNPKKQFQLESLLQAGVFWSGVENASGISPGYTRSGRLQPLRGTASIETARARGGNARSLWAGQARWDVTNEPVGWDISAEAYVRDTLSAQIHPRMAIQSLTRALSRHGVQVAGTAAENAGAVIWATGVQGLAALSDAVGREIGRGIKGQAALLRLDKRGAPQLFIDALHVIPHPDGTVAIGSTTEREFDSPNQTGAALDAVIERARAVVPDLTNAPVIERWAGVRPRAKSRAPVLGPWPDRPGHFVANGGFKIGFGMAPGVAGVMADLVLKGEDRIPTGFRVEDCL